MHLHACTCVCTYLRVYINIYIHTYIHMLLLVHSSLYTQNVLQIVDKLPTIGTQLKIIASVKATTQGGDGQLDMKFIILFIVCLDL